MDAVKKVIAFLTVDPIPTTSILWHHSVSTVVVPSELIFGLTCK